MSNGASDADELRYASLGDRFLGFFIDNIFLAILVIPMAFLEGVLMIVYFLIFAVFVLFYILILEGIWSNQTVGKYVLNIKVAKEDGSRASIPDSVVRNTVGIIGQAFGWIGIIVGAIFIWQSEENQRLGDNLASTVVVKTT